MRARAQAPGPFRKFQDPVALAIVLALPWHCACGPYAYWNLVLLSVLCGWLCAMQWPSRPAWLAMALRIRMWGVVGDVSVTAIQDAANFFK